MSVKRRGDPCHRLPPVCNDELRTGKRKFPLAYDCRRAARCGFRREFVPVLPRAAETKKEIPLARNTAVRTQSAYFGVAAAKFPRFLRQFRKFHSDLHRL